MTLQLTPDGKIPSLRPEPQRDRYGRYVLPSPAGGRASWTRATTVVGALKDLNGLIGWKQRMTAVGMAKRPELGPVVLEVNEGIVDAGKDWRQAKPFKDEMTSIIESATHAAGADAGSSAGTEAHTLSEWADAGRLDEVRHLATKAQMADLMAYLECMVAAGIERPTEHIERIVINTAVESAGTYDRLVRLADGRLVVADLKSQQSVDFGFLEICCQLAQYANADYLVDGERLVAMPADLDRRTGIVMHAPVGSATCVLYEIDLEVGWEAALTAHKVRQLRSASKRLGWSYERPAASVVIAGEVAQTLYLIRHAQTRDSLTGLWRAVVTAGREWTDEMTEAARVRSAELEAS